MCENLYGVCFGGPFRNHWEVGGLTYGPGEVFESSLTADEEEKIWVDSELRKWGEEERRRVEARRGESQMMRKRKP
jgi:hypothetical protein